MLNLFGRPTLTSASGDRIEILPTGWRLLAVLAAGPAEGVARAELAGLVISTAKLSTLRKLVWDVRRMLDGTGIDLLDGDASVLRLSDRVYCDVRDLQAPKQKRPLRDIYKGPFFDVGPAFHHKPWTTWLARRREELRDLYIDRVSDALTSVEVDWSTKLQDARHVLKHAPDHAGATQVLMLQGAQAADGREIRLRYRDLQDGLRLTGSQPDRPTTDFFHRLVGESQRELGTERKSEVMDLPTIYVSTPSAATRSKAGRMVRSLLTDITIGLCRASLFRVTISETPDKAKVEATGSLRAYYLIASSVINHVLGHQIVFTLTSLPQREILWTEKIAASDGFTVAAYNLLTAGVLRSLIRRIKDVEIEAFRLDADPSAYASYLAGYSSLTSLDLAKLRRGRHHLRRSMSQSPSFAPTTSALAKSYQLEWLVTGRGEQDLLSKAREHSLHAIASDPLEARGFKALGFCDLFDKRYDAALENYSRAEQLNRNYADLIAEHANCLLHCGLLDQSLEKMDYAMQLNPDFGDMYRWTKACTCFLLSRYSEVLDIVEEMQDREPALRILAATYALLGNKAEAQICRMRAMKTYPTMTFRDGSTSSRLETLGTSSITQRVLPKLALYRI